MEEHLERINRLSAEISKWRARTIEAARVACANCEEYAEGRRNCGGCKIRRYGEEAAAPWKP